MQTLILKPGDQVAYIPDHADGRLDHPNTEFGFVTSVKPELEVAFCRYWSKYAEGELRTCANSEATPIENLVLFESHPQEMVDQLLAQIQAML